MTSDIIETVETDLLIAEAAIKAELQNIENEIIGKVADVKVDVSALRTLLENLFIIAKNDVTKTEQEIIDLATKLVAEYHSVLKNCGIMLNHTKQVYESMTIRNSGVLPDELVKGTASFKDREGWKDLNMVLEQVLPVFRVPAPPKE